MSSLSKSQIDRLGDRLRAHDEISDDDLGLLQQLRAVHDDALAEVTEILSQLSGPNGQPLAPTPRLKTVQTIQDKLQRERMRLSQMQDVAGARIVSGDTHLDQDAVVDTILKAFPGARMVDRRERPSFGYRAVHVIVKHLDCLVEVQVRTTLQHGWAEMMERLADLWGRQIRYGAAPDDPQTRLRTLTRDEVVDDVRRLADLGASMEEIGSAAKAALQSGGPADEAQLDVGLRTASEVRELLDRLGRELKGGLA